MMLSLRSRAPMSSSRPAPGRRATLPRLVARVSPKEDIEKAQKVLEEALKEAEETCDDKGVKSAECAVAFDNAEEISAAIAHKKADAARSDPLEQFCESNPDADECRIYDD